MKFLLKQQIENDEYLYINDILQNLKDELNNTKSLIDNYPKEWEIVKKQIHDYEYVYTSSNYYNNLSKISPFSRSYFKFNEMYYEFNLIEQNKKNKIACLAEAPGGFVQSIFNLLDKDIEILYGVTLLSRDNKVPKWNSLLKQNPKIKFLFGKNKDGDLYDLNNVLSIINNIGKNTIDLVTADGGIDYSVDYSKQEENSIKLIYSEIFVALNIQKKGGNFICKIFDIFKKETILLIYKLNILYESVSFYKPNTSRLSNSEKYIVCQGYKGYNKAIINELCLSFNNNKLEYPISKIFLNNIYEYNEYYCKNQIDYINKGINIIKNKKMSSKPNQSQIEKSINWCKKYNIPLNMRCIYLYRTFT
jgi:23S rRNA U2552 (ribose-2'-O)-methylase RlmE/FtsJ